MGLTPRKYKVNLIRNLTFRCFRICSSPRLLQLSLDELKRLLSQNGYPRGVVNYNMNDVLQATKQTINPNHHSSQKENVLSFTLFRPTKQNRS